MVVSGERLYSRSICHLKKAVGLNFIIGRKLPTASSGRITNQGSNQRHLRALFVTAPKSDVIIQTKDVQLTALL